MKKKLLKIRNTSVAHALGFFFDGCHKIYVAENEHDIREMYALWGEGVQIRPMDSLEEIFRVSCSLRFISWVNLDKPCIVPQCAKQVTFTYNTGKSIWTSKENS